MFAPDDIPLCPPAADRVGLERPFAFGVAKSHRAPVANRAGQDLNPARHREHDPLFAFVDGRAEFAEDGFVVHPRDVHRGGRRDQRQSFIGGEERGAKAVDVVAFVVVDRDSEPGLEAVEVALETLADGLPFLRVGRDLAGDLVAGDIAGDVRERASLGLCFEIRRESENALRQIRSQRSPLALLSAATERIARRPARTCGMTAV